MRVTRYFQSCLLIEDGDIRILVDPSAREGANLENFGHISAVFYTHQHGDHFDANLAKRFIEEASTTVYANESTAKLIHTDKTDKKIIVKSNQEFDVEGMKVQAKDLPHCLMWDGSQGPQNTGFKFADKLFHPGDGKELANYSAEVVALPINGPDISIKDAIDFARQMQAKILIPVHYDYLGGNPQVFSDIAKGQGFTTHVLEDGGYIDL